MPISEKVRSGPGIPTIESFASHNGTPIVIDTDTGIGYVMRGDMAIVTLDGTVIVAPPSAEYFIDSADFDGTNDYLTSGALTGAADSKLLTVVFWIRVDTWTEFARMHSNSGGGASYIRLVTSSNNGIQLYFENPAGSSTTMNIRTATSFAMAINTWYCVMASVDMADTAKRHLYVGDTDRLSVTSYTDSLLDFTKTTWSWGGHVDGSAKIDAQIADLWFAPGQYIDFSVEANRRKFFSSTGKPVDLGASGSTPTGVAPIVFHHILAGEAPANFALNRGTGGNFTVNGTLTAGSVPPGE